MRGLWALLVGVVCAAALAAVSPAHAGQASNRPNATLDGIASEVAGRPVSVWCEMSPFDWDVGFEPYGAAGFYAPSIPNVVWISPRQCETLHLGLTYGYREVGLIYLASAVLTLAHEGVHARGVVDEGQTDCTAVPLVVPLLERYFQLTRTVDQLVVQPVTRTVRRKIAGKWRRVRMQTLGVASSSVPNPDHSRASEWVLSWHRSKPADYQGMC